ncbi:MAG: response regulator transcription factor [Bacteroidales bacterium]
MLKRTHIVIVEPSVIIRSGLIAVLQRATNLNINIAEMTEILTISEDLLKFKPDIIIVNPTYFGYIPLAQLREENPNMKIIALQSALTDQNAIKLYNETISIYDTTDSINSALSRAIETGEASDSRTELSQREKEIVVCVAKGMSNKEIADTLFLSTHTVISHRRNITAKLDIYSASGLTIYAIVNKLIDIDSIPAK